jgi:hypothetical protein
MSCNRSALLMKSPALGFHLTAPSGMEDCSPGQQNPHPAFAPLSRTGERGRGGARQSTAHAVGYVIALLRLYLRTA